VLNEAIFTISLDKEGIRCETPGDICVPRLSITNSSFEFKLIKLGCTSKLYCIRDFIEMEFSTRLIDKEIIKDLELAPFLDLSFDLKESSME
jgi:hypothetical protein